MKRRDAVFALLAAPALAAPAWAQQTVKQFSGKALDSTSGQWLYTEQHRQVWDGDRWLSGTIRYVTPQGQLMAEKSLDFSQDRFIPLTRMAQAAVGHEEAITKISADAVTMETSDGGQRKTDDVKRSSPMAADSGFHSFVVANFDALMAGKTVTLAFGVVSQRTTFRFRIKKTDVVEQGGQTRVSLLAEPDSLLRLLAAPLKLVYDGKTRDLLEYDGLSNLTDPATRKTPSVRIVYDYAKG